MRGSVASPPMVEPAHPAVERVERRFLPRLRVLQHQFQQIFPTYEITVWSSSVGDLTSFQGWDIGMEVAFPDAAPAEANCVALTIGLRHLHAVPQIDAGVAWCAGRSPGVDTELFSEPIPFDDDAFERVARGYSRLVEALMEAIQAWIESHPRE